MSVRNAKPGDAAFGDHSFVSTSEPILQRVLLTNDDGVHAPGLQALRNIAATLAREVWVVAPEHDQSGTSHAISLHAPLRVRQQGPRCYAITGTPGDCVVLGARHLMAEPPDLVLAGVNRGANLGIETVFSGTVGAAMTGLLLGLRAMALSQAYTDGHPVRWETAATHAPGVIRRLLAVPWAGQSCLNLNFPDVPPESAGPLTVTRQGAGSVQDIAVESHVDPRAIAYHWLRFKRGSRDNSADSETAVLRAGGIAVTPLRFERTDDTVYTALRESLLA